MLPLLYLLAANAVGKNKTVEKLIVGVQDEAAMATSRNSAVYSRRQWLLRVAALLVVASSICSQSGRSSPTHLSTFS